MSNSLAVATVTAAVRNLLTSGIAGDPELADTTVTAQALDKARGTNNANQLNVFLYQIMVNPALRNMEPPHLVKRGETGQPPLALNLYYLVTAYGRDNDDIFTHRLLGRAMSILHDHPLLGADEIKAALPENDLFDQFERVRFTWQSLSLEDTSKLWAGFQGQYRLSVAYEAAVVLIDSTRPIRTPLPVLSRGADDRGAISQADATAPFPAIEELKLPNPQNSVRPGDVLTITGRHLDGDKVVVRFTSTRLPAPIDLPPDAGSTAETINVTLPNDPANWVAGFYTVSGVISRKDRPDWTTNELPLPLSALITGTKPKTPKRDAAGNVTLTVTCSPEVRPEQRVMLLLGDRAIPADAHPTQTASPTFTVKGAEAGTFVARLRVDGVDSLPFDPAATPRKFDDKQTVTIT
ncbi:MAG: DUF4255 domain-containing protein [Chloroflexia bacterium]